ncbi:MucB/RseB C-terminal domain-containing protein [Halomonas piscis]|uniref:MucB/RseB C-terminal domain-containing protein n=1 Tax=Halomonas piscis TaxID=3031727 RepID=A0ABY9Z3B6_9GAMM|nr:MucB/RseB C-terminal domain-containing protein [Halomonas piscis]WNK21491.1 MucB/RseB C-terminal domain-containing protein [Halomonas piscis]
MPDFVACRSLSSWHLNGRGAAFALLTALGLLMATPAAAAEENADEPAGEATLRCKSLGEETPQTPVAWLTASLKASHCYSFQARAVAIDALNVRTLALSHRIQDGVRQQVIQHLDGPSVNVERRARAGLWGWPGGRPAPAEGAGSAGESADAPAPMPRRWAEHVASVYDITLDADKRVADRDAVALTFTPKSGDRYRHQWWLDQNTGLLLKHVLRDNDDAILETFQITRLKTPERYTRDVSVAPPQRDDGPNWKTGWLPEGMVEQPDTVEKEHEDRTRRLYSDGLSTVSVFVEAPAATTALATGVHRLGASAIAVERHDTADPWQVIAIGEVPPRLLGRIARSVTRTAPDTEEPEASDSPSDAPNADGSA